MQSDMVRLAQGHLFTIDSGHLHGEPIQMLMFHFQALNRAEVMHLYLSTPTNDTSLAQITSSKFIGPTNFQPFKESAFTLNRRVRL